MSNYDLTPTINLYNELINKFTSKLKPNGRPFKFTEISFLLFFMTMTLKGIYQFKTMEAYAKIHFKRFRFPSAPSRSTIRRRFLQLSGFIEKLLPYVCKEVLVLDERFDSKEDFIDRSLFASKGTMIHKSQRDKLKSLKNKTVDFDASWGYSPYKQWVFGYSIHMISNANRFPVNACVTTGKIREYTQVENLISSVSSIVLLVGDCAYKVIQTIESALKNFGVFIISPDKYKSKLNQFKIDYSYMIQMQYAKHLLSKRKSSVEATFSLIKELFNLKAKAQLPYLSLKYVSSFLYLTVFTLQFMMVSNSINNINLGSISPFKLAMDL